MKLSDVILNEYKTSAEEELAKYYDEETKTKEDEYFISYTDVEKIGINPQSKYNTPIGIYTYPLKLTYDKYKLYSNATNVPFAGDKPNIWVLKSKTNNVLDLQQYTKKDLDSDVKMLYRFVKDWVKAGAVLAWDSDGLNKRSVFFHMVEVAKDTAFVPNPAGYIWNITRVLSNTISDTYTSKESVIWNYLLREVLGYDMFIDNGDGIVHSSEPIQAGFLTKTAFKTVDILKNTHVSKKKHKELSLVRNQIRHAQNHIKKDDTKLNAVVSTFMNLFDQLHVLVTSYPHEKETNRLLKKGKNLLINFLQKYERTQGDAARDILLGGVKLDIIDPLYQLFTENEIETINQEIKKILSDDDQIAW